MNNYLGYVKAYSLAGDLVFGEIVRVADRFHVVELVNNLITGLSISLIPIDSTRFAKKIAEVPTGEYIFEFDAFITPDGNVFYVVWDYTRLAVIYSSLDGNDLSNDINIFECKYIGNIKLDDNLVEQ